MFIVQKRSYDDVQLICLNCNYFMYLELLHMTECSIDNSDNHCSLSLRPAADDNDENAPCIQEN